ncbi:hypothetical protein GGP47_003025 [Salinibacter ruber]|nr:hypothetical protein [Salinibacter ruber]
MEGLDTGFFFDLRAGRSGAQELWRTVTERDDPAAVSNHALSVFQFAEDWLS